MIEEAIASLPRAQREVITLRDVEGWTAEEVCNALGIADTNQRVLLHRGRARVRSALERYLVGSRSERCGDHRSGRAGKLTGGAPRIAGSVGMGP